MATAGLPPSVIVTLITVFINKHTLHCVYYCTVFSLFRLPTTQSLLSASKNECYKITCIILIIINIVRISYSIIIHVKNLGTSICSFYKHKFLYYKVRLLLYKLIRKHLIFQLLHDGGCFSNGEIQPLHFTFIFMLTIHHFPLPCQHSILSSFSYFIIASQDLGSF